MTMDLNRRTAPCYGIIPARYGSKRFPGKPLTIIFGKPMIWHVYVQAIQCPQLAKVVVATDDERILSAAEALEIPVLMTGLDHASGTDRVLEAARLLALPPHAVVVNIQGDEPALEPAMLTQLVQPFSDSNVEVTTLACQIGPQEAQNADQVKVVFNASGQALYFSRAPIPYPRESQTSPFYGHIGLYAFRMQALERFAGLKPSPLERTEKLEQLRMLENSIPVQVVVTSYKSVGVDRPEDVETVSRLLVERKQASYIKAHDLTQPPNEMR